MEYECPLTVIVPCFNVEDYIEKNIESLLAQDLDGAEYLFVNDGSTDGTRDIILQYMQQYPNIRLVEQENGGLGAARNTGIKNSRGKYIIFLDSDDYIEPNCLKYITDVAIENRLDMLYLGHKAVDEEGKILGTTIAPDSEGVVKGTAWLMSSKADPASCFYLYSGEFLRNLDFGFMGRVYHEDMDFTIHALYRAERVMSVNYNFYYYLLREGSISQHFSTKRITDYYEVANRVDSWVKEEVDSETYEGYFCEYLAFLYSHVMNMCVQNDVSFTDLFDKNAAKVISQHMLAAKAFKHRIFGLLLKLRLFRAYSFLYKLAKG